MLRPLILAGITCPLLAPAASAQMLGQVVDAEWIFPSFPIILEAHTLTVVPGFELTPAQIANSGNLFIDVGDDWIEFSFSSSTSWTVTGFNGWRFRDTMDGLPRITGFSIDSFSTGVGDTAGITTGFNDEECWVDLAGMTVPANGGWIRFEVQFDTVGSPFCFGDASDTLCPCGNIGVAGEGCQNSTTVGGVLSSGGSSLAGADDLVLSGSQLPPGVTALFFSGDAAIAPALSFGDGLRCAGGAIVRLETVSVDGAGSAATSIGIAGLLGANTGDRHVFQLWYRDNAGPCGSGWNTTGAIDLTWQ